MPSGSSTDVGQAQPGVTRIRALSTRCRAYFRTEFASDRTLALESRPRRRARKVGSHSLPKSLLTISWALTDPTGPMGPTDPTGPMGPTGKQAKQRRFRKEHYQEHFLVLGARRGERGHGRSELVEAWVFLEHRAKMGTQHRPQFEIGIPSADFGGICSRRRGAPRRISLWHSRASVPPNIVGKTAKRILGKSPKSGTSRKHWSFEGMRNRAFS